MPEADVVDVDEIPTLCAKVVPPPACGDAGGDNCSQPQVAHIAPS